MSQLRIVLFAKTVLMSLAYNVKQAKLMKDKAAQFHGVLAIMLIILTASINGQVKRKQSVLCAKMYGTLLRLPNNEI
jgi:hypothetical protein